MKITTEIYKDSEPCLMLWYGMDEPTGFEDSTLKHVLQPQSHCGSDWRVLMATMSANAITIKPFPDKVYKKIEKILMNHWKQEEKKK